MLILLNYRLPFSLLIASSYQKATLSVDGRISSVLHIYAACETFQEFHLVVVDISELALPYCRQEVLAFTVM